MDNSEIEKYFSESLAKLDEISQKIFKIFRNKLINANWKEIESIGRKKFVFFLRREFNKDIKHISVEIFFNGDISIKFIFPPRRLKKVRRIFIDQISSFSDKGEKIWIWFEDQAEDAKKYLFYLY